MEVKVETNGNKINVKSDYSKEFVTEARKLNGKWNGEAWTFDLDDEIRVRKVLKEVYGSDGNSVEETARVCINLDELYVKDKRELELFGRVLLYRPDRDKQIKLHSSVIVVEGEFPPCGGSVKHPRLDYIDGTKIEVKDVPISLVKKAMEKSNSIKIIEKNKKDKEELKKEKELLLKRLEEINKLLEEN